MQARNSLGWGASAAVTATPTGATVTIAAGDGVTEGSAAVFTLTRSRDLSLSLSVSVSVSETGGDMVASGDEGTKTVSFAVETLTADTSAIADADGLDDAVFGYQWIRSDGDAETDIEDATGATYTLTAAETGKAVKVRVAFTDDGGTDETLTSAATGTVAAANAAPTGLPAVSGTARVGETLTADTSAIADTDGLEDATFSYQWIVVDGDAETDIGGATEASYTLTAAEAGKTVKVRVSFTDDAGTEETLTSAATAAVSAALSEVSIAAAASPVTARW